MKAVVIGAGEVGLNIAQHLLMEDHDVVVVDSDPENLRNVNEQLDVQVIEGIGSYPTVLEQAGCADADILIAVTRSDETNMIACQMAYSLYNVPLKIARVRDADYLSVSKHGVYTPENMPVDVIISPEREVAYAIVRTLAVPGSFDTVYFARDKVAMIGVSINDRCALLNKSFKKIANQQELFSPCAIIRRDRLIVPHSTDHLEVGDEFYFVCAQRDVTKAMHMLGYENQETRRAFVIGGGNVGASICKELETMGMRVKVLEKDRKRAEYLAETLDETTVLCGHALDQDLLIQESIADMDVVVSATSDDSANALSSILSKQMGAKSVITLAVKRVYANLGESLGLDKIISPREITASRILQHIRHRSVHALHTIHGGVGEMMEVRVRHESSLAGARVSEIDVPEEVVIGAIVQNDGSVVLPKPNTRINSGDRVIMFASAQQIPLLQMRL